MGRSHGIDFRLPSRTAHSPGAPPFADSPSADSAFADSAFGARAASATTTRIRADAAPAAVPRRAVLAGSAFGATLALALTACSAPAPSTSTFILTDSAGVAVAESTAPAWSADSADSATAWTLDPTPVLDLAVAGSGPDHEFDGVAGMGTLSDGRIAVASYRSNTIRVYSPDGRLLATGGGEGDGPGEFRQITRMDVLPADSLLVVDFGGRVTWLDPDLHYARSVPLPPLSRDITWLGDGVLMASLFKTGVTSYEGESATLREPETLVTYDASGALLDTITTTAGGEQYMAVDGPRRASIGLFFGRVSTATGRDGRIWAGDSDSLAYDVFRTDGTLERRVRVPGYDLSIDPDEVAMRQDSVRVRYANRDPFIRDAYERMPVPATRPAYSDFVVDALGNLWAGAHVDRYTYGDPRDWIVFDPDGRWLGSLTLPPFFEVHEIGEDYILGVGHDALDVEHPRKLRLRRRERRTVLVPSPASPLLPG